ncbi:MAG: zf-HC2 domain-containing protein, partial [Planctomycetes bacterium]|nr:zf-HC2 domain-containing protein [Planctomycetota bacterium]
MACSDLGHLLSKLVDGELAPAERARVEEHLAGCAPCRAELEVLHRNEQLVREALCARFFENDLADGVLR